MILNYTIKEIRQTGGSKRPPSAKRPESALAKLLKKQQEKQQNNNKVQPLKKSKFTTMKQRPSSAPPKSDNKPLKVNIKSLPKSDIKLSPSNPGSALLIPVVEIGKQDPSPSPSPSPSPPPPPSPSPSSALSPPIKLRAKPPEGTIKPIKKKNITPAKFKSDFLFPFPVSVYKLGGKLAPITIQNLEEKKRKVLTNFFKQISKIGQIQPYESQKDTFIKKMKTLIKLNNPQEPINKKYTNMFTNASTKIYHKVNNEYIETDLSQIENKNTFDIVINIFDILKFFKRKNEDNPFHTFIKNMIEKSILLSKNICKFYISNKDTIIKLISKNNKESLYNKLWTSYKNIVDKQYIEDINTISGCNKNIEKIKKDNFENLQNVKIKVLSYHINEWTDKLNKTESEYSLKEFKNKSHENIKLYYKCEK